MDLKNTKYKCSSFVHEQSGNALTKIKLIDMIAISNIPFQYVRELFLYYNEAEHLRDIGRKLTDVIP